MCVYIYVCMYVCIIELEKARYEGDIAQRRENNVRMREEKTGMCVFMCVCVCVCVHDQTPKRVISYIYIYTYIHIYIYIYIYA